MRDASVERGGTRVVQKKTGKYVQIRDCSKNSTVQIYSFSKLFAGDNMCGCDSERDLSERVQIIIFFKYTGKPSGIKLLV